MKLNLDKVFKPFKLNDKITIKNKIFMSSMNRQRGDKNNLGMTTDIMNTYYSQRSSAGLIYSEPLFITPNSFTSIGELGIWSDKHIEGWKKINENLHNKNGLIFASLSHGGRTSHSKVNGGKRILSASSISANVKLYPGAYLLNETPEEISDSEIQEIFEYYHSAAIRAKTAGFDGINIHSTSGGLIESFLKSNCNIRKDKWGGMGGINFLTEIIKRTKDIYKSEEISIKLNPVDQYGNVYDEDPKTKYMEIIKRLADLKIGFIEMKETTNDNYNKENRYKPSEQIESCIKYFGDYIRQNNILLVSNLVGKKMEERLKYIERNETDFISCATLFISNPNLVDKLKNNISLVIPERIESDLNFEAKGYIDY